MRLSQSRHVRLELRVNHAKCSILRFACAEQRIVGVSSTASHRRCTHKRVSQGGPFLLQTACLERSVTAGGYCRKLLKGAPHTQSIVLHGSPLTKPRPLASYAAKLDAGDPGPATLPTVAVLRRSWVSCCSRLNSPVLAVRLFGCAVGLILRLYVRAPAGRARRCNKAEPC